MRKSIRIFNHSIMVSTLTVMLLSQNVMSKAVDEEQPVLYYADEQVYDADLGVLILKGRVEFLHKGEVLEADHVTYNENIDLVTASGNVRLRRTTGDVVLAEYAELTGDIKDGIVRQAKALMADGGRLAAIEGRKFENREEFDKAVYTPCKICGPGDTPSWQLDSRRIVRDSDDKMYYFTDSVMRVAGVPVMYMPYLHHPTERKSGLLTPTPGFGSNKEGFFWGQPLFIDLGNDKDVTLTPYFYTNRPIIWSGNYRQAFDFGRIDLEGSVTKTEDRSISNRSGIGPAKSRLPDNRGHFWGDAEFSITEAIRFIGEGGWVSDQTYFRRFPFFSHRSDVSLDSKAVLEGFWDRDYAAANVYHFQSLKQNVKQRNVADALPFLEYHAVSRQDPLGGRFYFDNNYLNLSRIQGRDVHRGVSRTKWEVPYVTPWGQELKAFGGFGASVYQVDNSPQSQLPIKNGSKSRFFPQGGGELRYPTYFAGQDQYTIFDPIVQIVAAPRGVNSSRLPVEDSSGFEFTDANILNIDRIPGEDLLDDGSRITYGLESITQGKYIGRYEGFIGQSFNFNQPNDTFKQQGLGNRSSDIVARFNAEPVKDWVSGHIRIRLDRGDFDTRFTELGGWIGPKILRANTNYVFVSRKAGAPNNQDFKQINYGFSSQFIDHWSAHIGERRDFSRDALGVKTPNGGKLEQSIGLQYQDDCLTAKFDIVKSFYRDRDLKPGTLFLFTIEFKNLGQFQQKFDLTRGGDRDRRVTSVSQDN